ncbi:protein of unknown function DUF1291 [Desulfatibacillum aliphaticivorans]|uniref:Uncharacterized protein n=1 Tax=Desulfatibacillum aliphaticivorans TaxID=218208 RepID=B8FM55_DESAL|nr:DsrE family protein [Desulfatibacillum aliphaticivorans]ACL05788.1 protein of unknown function DUF1291 [Desulfatibacillum aliphaticivorans]
MNDAHSKNALVVVWSSKDPEVAMNMVFMYCRNSKIHGWWESVKLVVWGPSAKLLSEDENLQAELSDMKKEGVEILACKACADRYGVSEALKELGCKVIYMGQPLTDYLKQGLHVLAF